MKAIPAGHAKEQCLGFLVLPHLLYAISFPASLAEDISSPVPRGAPWGLCCSAGGWHNVSLVVMDSCHFAHGKLGGQQQPLAARVSCQSLGTEREEIYCTSGTELHFYMLC